MYKNFGYKVIQNYTMQYVQHICLLKDCSSTLIVYEKKQQLEGVLFFKFKFLNKILLRSTPLLQKEDSFKKKKLNSSS